MVRRSRLARPGARARPDPRLIRHARAEVESLLGSPDDVFRRGETMYAAALGDGEPRAVEIRVCRFRGLHDFLCSASDGTRVLSWGWWFAWE